MLRKVQEEAEEKVKKIKESMVKERNREIEAIIEKLGDETHQTQKQNVVQYENKLKEMEQKNRIEVEE